MQQRVWACILYCLAVSALQAHSARTLTGQVSFADIQNAINGLPNINPASPTAVDVDTRTIIIQDTDGFIDLTTNSLVLQKIGVTLRGAGPGPTGKVTFYSSANTGTPVAPSPGGCAAPSEGVPMLQICRDAPNLALGTPTMPIVIDNIRFENTNANHLTAGPEKGIGEQAHTALCCCSSRGSRCRPMQQQQVQRLRSNLGGGKTCPPDCMALFNNCQ